MFYFNMGPRLNLRHRAYSLQLPEHRTQLSDSNFMTRMLYKTYISPVPLFIYIAASFLLSIFFHVSCCWPAFFMP